MLKQDFSICFVHDVVLSGRTLVRILNDEKNIYLAFVVIDVTFLLWLLHNVNNLCYKFYDLAKLENWVLKQKNNKLTLVSYLVCGFNSKITCVLK